MDGGDWCEPELNSSASEKCVPRDAIHETKSGLSPPSVHLSRRWGSQSSSVGCCCFAPGCGKACRIILLTLDVVRVLPLGESRANRKSTAVNRRLHSKSVVGVVRDFATVIRPGVGLWGRSCARRNRFVKSLALDVN
jgi:hypothetical protein